MKFTEKLLYIQDNHFSEWLKTRQKVEDKISNSQQLICVCGRLATGLHEGCCRKFQYKVNVETVKKLEILLKIKYKK